MKNDDGFNMNFQFVNVTGACKRAILQAMVIIVNTDDVRSTTKTRAWMTREFS